jgi:hypothetical protein
MMTFGEFHVFATDKAKQVILKDGFHTTMCVTLDANGGLNIISCPYANDIEKMITIRMLKSAIKEMNAVHYTFICESRVIQMPMNKENVAIPVPIDALTIVTVERDTRRVLMSIYECVYSNGKVVDIIDMNLGNDMYGGTFASLFDE